MARRVASVAVTVGIALSLAGCAFSFFGYGERRAEWRDKEDRACMVRNEVRETPWIQRVRNINDRGVCGIDRPLRVSAFERGAVALGPTATLNCPMTATVERWLRESVQPAAVGWFGSNVVSIKQISAYACRTKNSERGASLSEHAFGNALDVAGFMLADGRVIEVKSGWGGADPNGRGFLREVLAASCQYFKTVLGPGVKYHGDHFHLDLAHHNKAGTSRYCRPQLDAVPQRPMGGGGLLSGTFLDMSPTGSVSTDGLSADEIGELLSEPPPGVVASELSDPFGTYDGNPDDPTAYAPN